MKIEPSVSTTEVFASLSYLCHIQLYLFLYKTVYDDVDYLFCIFDWSTISKNFSVNDFKCYGVISLNFNLDSIQSTYSGIQKAMLSLISISCIPFKSSTANSL